MFSPVMPGITEGVQKLNGKRLLTNSPGEATGLLNVYCGKRSEILYAGRGSHLLNSPNKLRTVERRCNDMRTYERPTLTAAGTFRKTGIGFRAGPERFWFFRRRFF
ncbi:keywimysin-related RiPP [Streptomyces violaceus]|uniref:keywimysin-related RiPP n=1 Tax=Streptomyces violaceus TaxID=1936 RepID=UPI0035C68719